MMLQLFSGKEENYGINRCHEAYKYKVIGGKNHGKKRQGFGGKVVGESCTQISASGCGQQVYVCSASAEATGEHQKV